MIMTRYLNEQHLNVFPTVLGTVAAGHSYYSFNACTLVADTLVLVVLQTLVAGTWLALAETDHTVKEICLQLNLSAYPCLQPWTWPLNVLCPSTPYCQGVSFSLLGLLWHFMQLSSFSCL